MICQKNINIAFLGCGGIANAHLNELQKIPGAVIKACWNRPEEFHLAESFKEKSGAAYCTKDYLKIAEDPEVDAVYICTMQNDRARLFESCAAAGKAIFMEKPLALRREDFQDIARIYRQYPVIFQSGYKLRFNSLMEYIAGQEFKPEAVYCHVADGAWADNHPATDNNIGGGHILSQGVYAAETLRLLAKSVPTAVNAMLNYSDSNGKIHGTLTANYRFQNNVIGSIMITDAGVAPAPVSKFYAEASGQQQSMIILDRFTGLVSIDAAGNRREAHFQEDGFYRQSVAFLDNVRNGNNTGCSFLDGIYPSMMIHLAMEAAIAQRTLSIDLNTWLQFSSSMWEKSPMFVEV
jgi:predicted dehydrogenase